MHNSIDNKKKKIFLFLFFIPRNPSKTKNKKYYKPGEKKQVKTINTGKRIFFFIRNYYRKDKRKDEEEEKITFLSYHLPLTT